MLGSKSTKAELSRSRMAKHEPYLRTTCTLRLVPVQTVVGLQNDLRWLFTTDAQPAKVIATEGHNASSDEAVSGGSAFCVSAVRNI